jgi:glucosamine--fructose-6-phosphate aminotransferase (isomerizing)
MGGIVGVVGQSPVAASILDALKRIQHREYNSAGIATLEHGLLRRRSVVGNLKNLENKLIYEPLVGVIGIGHTCRGTNGPPNKNAHPHAVDGVAVVHNGSIENYRELRNELKQTGARFATDTDTEVIAHFVSQQLKNGYEPLDAVHIALLRLEGSFALAFLFEGHENLIIAVCRGSPLAVGYGRGEMCVGSDAIALKPFTDVISYLEDDDIVIVTRQGIDFLNARGELVRRSLANINGSAARAQKGKHLHIILKEIREQPKVVGQTLERYIDPAGGQLKLPNEVTLKFRDINRVSIAACGTGFYAGLIARYWFEHYAALPAEIDIASEFRYRGAPLDSGNLAVIVSQSGETADTFASLEFAKVGGQRILSVVNVPSSTIARGSQILLPTLAGPEGGVGSIEVFTCQLAALACLAIAAGRERRVLSADDETSLIRGLADVPSYMTSAFELNSKIREISRKIARSRNALFIGCGTNYPLALEGALKLKEITDIHAEGYPAGELKHGPIAFIDRNLPVVVIAPSDTTFENTMSNMQEVIARGGRTILITDHKGASVATECWEVLALPDMSSLVAPLVFALPLQLLAYHTALAFRTDVDQPRNLANSVTAK